MSPLELPPVSAPLPWQADAWAEVNHQLQNEQLPHALLLAGERYTGKARFALALARLLLCHSPADGMNCGKCHACALSASGGHGDTRWLEPEEKSRVIKIDQVREVVAFVNKTASFGQRKVIVITPADSMNSNAANALLKSLEEPASDTFLILVCHRVHGVPATIRSRCQIRRLPPPGVEAALDWLDKVTGERARSEQLLEIAEGRPLLAEELYESDGAEQLAALRQGLQAVMSGRAVAKEVGALLAELDIEDLLARIAAEVRALLRGLESGQIPTGRGRAAFAFLDEITGIQRAVAGGANPTRQLLVDARMARMQRELGPAGSGDSMGVNQGDVRP